MYYRNLSTLNIGWPTTLQFNFKPARSRMEDLRTSRGCYTPSPIIMLAGDDGQGWMGAVVQKTARDANLRSIVMDSMDGTRGLLNSKHVLCYGAMSLLLHLGKDLAFKYSLVCILFHKMYIPFDYEKTLKSCNLTCTIQSAAHH